MAERLKVNYKYFLWKFPHKKRRVINPEIKWLMDPKTEYPQYWMGIHENPFKHCASIYGSQGFETDYVGLIWGEDLVWRGKWVVQQEKITDIIGGRSYNGRCIKKIPECWIWSFRGTGNNSRKNNE